MAVLVPPTKVFVKAPDFVQGPLACYAMMRPCYDLHMRTTISLDDRLAEEVRRRAAAEGMSVSAFIARILDDRLKQREPKPQRPFRLVTVGGPGVVEGVNLDRPRSIETAADESTWTGRG